MSFQETFPEVIETTLVRQPSTPQIKIKNPLAKNIFVNSIQLFFDAYFSEKGVIMIKINRNIILAPKKAGAFARLKGFSVPMKNLQFLRQQNIEIFAWNGKDLDKVKVNVDIHISEDSDLQIPIDQVLGQSQRNVSLSIPEILFSELNRQIGSFTKLVDMQGYKKLIVLLGKTSPVLIGAVPTIDTAFPNGNDPSPLSNLTDGKLNTGAGWNMNGPSGQRGIVELDFGSIGVRHLKVHHKVILTPVEEGTVRILTSDTDSSYNLKFTRSYLQNTNVTETLDATEHSFRFVHLEYVIDLNNWDGTIFEIFDANKLGGTGAISFEVRNILSGDWGEFISASEFGTITDGINDVVKQVGDVNTMSVSGFTYGLPSTQTDFRAKYSISVGALTNSVTLIKVA